MTTFFPSTYPSSRRPCRNASMRAGLMERETAVRNPIRETFFGCCASAVTATASSITAIRIDDTPAFFIAHLILDVLITRTEIKESVIYGGRRYTFVEYKGQSHAEIELNDATVKIDTNVGRQPHREQFSSTQRWSTAARSVDRLVRRRNFGWWATPRLCPPCFNLLLPEVPRYHRAIISLDAAKLLPAI